MKNFYKNIGPISVDKEVISSTVTSISKYAPVYKDLAKNALQDHGRSKMGIYYLLYNVLLNAEQINEIDSRVISFVVELLSRKRVLPNYGDSWDDRTILVDHLLCDRDDMEINEDIRHFVDQFGDIINEKSVPGLRSKDTIPFEKFKKCNYQFIDFLNKCSVYSPWPEFDI